MEFTSTWSVVKTVHKPQLDDHVMKVGMLVWVLSGFGHVELLSYFCDHSTITNPLENFMNNVTDLV